MGLQEEVWPFSPYFLKGNWRAKLAETRLTVPPPEKHTRTNSRVDPDGEIERHDARVLGTAQHQDVRRLWLRRRGSLANSWKRRRSGGGRGGGSGASAKPRHSSVHVRRRVLLTSELPGGGNEGSGAFTNVGKRPSVDGAFKDCRKKIENHLEMKNIPTRRRCFCVYREETKLVWSWITSGPFPRTQVASDAFR